MLQENKVSLTLQPTLKRQTHTCCARTQIPWHIVRNFSVFIKKILVFVFFLIPWTQPWDFMNLGHHPTLGNTSKRALVECMHWRFSKEWGRIYHLFQNTGFFKPFECIAVFLELSFSVCLRDVHLWIVRGCLRSRVTHWRGVAQTQVMLPLFIVSWGHLQSTWRSSRQGCLQSLQVCLVVARYPQGSVRLWSEIYLVSFRFLVSLAGSARQFQAGDRGYCSSPSFPFQGMSTHLQWEEWLQVTFTCLFFGLSGDSMAVRIVCFSWGTVLYSKGRCLTDVGFVWCHGSCCSLCVT